MKKWVVYFQHLLNRTKLAFYKRPITIEYPYVVKQIPLLAQTSLKNNFSECVVCYDCEKKCPVQAIEIQAHEFAPNTLPPVTTKGVPLQKEMDSFKIDYNKCVMCGLCVNICPTKSLDYEREFIRPKTKSHELIVDLVHIPRAMRGKQFEN